jgi:nucleoside-diphosphate-sugar epimerase
VDDVLVFASARAPCRDVETLRENIAMAAAVCAALQSRPVAHLVYISSDAVYKDTPQPLTEASCAEPASARHHAPRPGIALRQACSGPIAP